MKNNKLNTNKSTESLQLGSNGKNKILNKSPARRRIENAVRGSNFKLELPENVINEVDTARKRRYEWETQSGGVRSMSSHHRSLKSRFGHNNSQTINYLYNSLNGSQHSSKKYLLARENSKPDFLSSHGKQVEYQDNRVAALQDMVQSIAER